MIYLYLFGTCFHFIYVFMIISNIIYVIGKKIIFVTELYKYSDENIQVSRFLYIVNIFLM